MRDTVFRVRGVPPRWTTDDLLRLIRIHLSDEDWLAVCPRVIFVPSCYNDDIGHTAFLFLNALPQVLAWLGSDPLADQQIGTVDGDLNVDRHFFGFTQLYAPRGGVIQAEYYLCWCS